MAFTVEDFEDMLRILEERPEWQERMRRAILTRDLLELPAEFAQLRQIVQELAEAQRRTEQRVEELAEAQRRTEQRVEELAEAQRRTEQRVEELAAAYEALVAEVRELRAIVAQLSGTVAEMQRTFNARLERLEQLQEEQTVKLGELERWQEGETGRRKGEQYERDTVGDAPVLFFGGQGGSPKEPEVRTQVGNWLRPYFLQGYEITELENPLRADLIWWKGDRVAVVEIGVKISRDDVNRAKARANTLRQAGIDAMPVVIGIEWGAPDIEAHAQAEGVEWYVRGGLSAGFLEFRRLPDGLDA
jgi:multidrug efflux pump subunit AcrA (membrane-fusion protein)